MAITFDPDKRDRTLRDRGLDFADADAVFRGTTIDIPDLRQDYGELRIRTVGYLRGRMVVVVWTQRGDARHVISMRKPMTANRKNTANSRRRIGSDLKKVDAYVLGPKDYAEIPELTEADFARGKWHIGGVPVSRGRPKSANPKQHVNLRLDPDVLDHFRAGGAGWQSRINAALRKVARLDRPGRRGRRKSVGRPSSR
jgi:uncharacterized protein (DUF4415 family)/uncharacterized DUF497 family protein